MTMGSGGITSRPIAATQGLTMADVIYLSQHGDEAQKFLADYAAAEDARAKVLAAADADRQAAAKAREEAETEAARTVADAVARATEIQSEAETTKKRADDMVLDVKRKDGELRQRAAALDARESAHRDRVAAMRKMLDEAEPAPTAPAEAA